MNFSPLTTISPIDGRYHSKTSELQPYFSEFGLIRYRVIVEVEYFIAMVESGVKALADFPREKYSDLRDISTNFSEKDAQWIKDIEKVTNHDVKAVEYFVKDRMTKLGLEKYLEFVHFGLTSQDINNTSVPLSMRDAVQNEYLPLLDQVIEMLRRQSNDWKDVAMLAKTHGQPASPTRLGKEIQVFVERLEVQRNQLVQVPFSAKFGGATGNFNAHHVAYSDNNWVGFANHFVNDILGLSRSQTTTQIEHYDNLAALFDVLKRINTILIDLDRDMWTYISMEYFKQQLKEGEVGSSAMPHKVNPIDFENSEGNLGIANALFEHLSAKLPVSRLQRDLTDSTVLRTIGMPLGHTFIAFKSTLKGLDKLLLNQAAFESDLENNWAVVAEAIQTILRREGFPKPYEALKGLTRTNATITKSSVHEFVDTLDISPELKSELKAISPQNYTGVQLVN
ncbi:MAG: adenylosuccinate lyase [Crocinitomicaceae bacterium]|jgi:adenylosuccinate lyase|nr:adenylosuccinate lyase [Crocinitomicaceae bacterium]MDG1658379.1 adenylosuccinate lyase [Crocinitomicaceae bacterium]MDG2441184.1 adenylosuccinate lyase [Crocinitomicaceae bacterium]